MNKTIAQQLAEKTMRELSSSNLLYSPLKSTSRSWKDPEGYRYLVPWSNAVLLRFFVRKFTESLPKSEYRRKSQVDDAARSVVRNVEEGFKRTTTSEYLQFIEYSQGSLEEVKGDIRELTEDRFMKSKPGSSLTGIGIDLGELNRELKEGKGSYGKLSNDRESKGSYGKLSNDRESKGSYGKLEQSKERLASSNLPLNSSKTPLRDFTYHPLTVLYPPLKDVIAQDLTYEIFIELINKTDWLLRKLVESLEIKLRVDKEMRFRGY